MKQIYQEELQRIVRDLDWNIPIPFCQDGEKVVLVLPPDLLPPGKFRYQVEEKSMYTIIN